MTLVTVCGAGSGPGGGAYACLPCARPLAEKDSSSRALQDAVASMEKRAAARAGRAL